ncbi:MAG: amidohydrolase family protein, partial [Candidatus Marinimicrobia bacterium]|nr:amidohydrolase family protein [Candidatus Neomarinimicrobiota bacterium]
MRQPIMLLKLTAIVIPALIMLACTGKSPATTDVIYHNAIIWTGVPDAPLAQAIAITGDRITAVGPDSSVLSMRRPDTRVVDLQGRFTVPGLIDNHTHFIDGGMQLASINLREAATPEQFSATLAEYASGLPEDKWITGGDWDHELWDGQLPERQWIDAITSRNPVFVSRLDGHMALANSVALKLAGISADTPDPKGGAIVRGADGQPTGVLKDEAMSLVYAVIPPAGETDLDQAALRAMDHAVALGITQVIEMGTWSYLRTHRRLHARSAMKMRVYSFVPLNTWSDLDDFIGQHGTGDDWHRWGGLKAFVDGSLGSTTAWFYDPYDDAPETSGLMVTDTADLRQWITEAD